MNRLNDYLSGIIGITPKLMRDEGAKGKGLPLYLRNYYQFVRVSLFGYPVILAVQHEGTQSATPAEYFRHHKILKEQLGGNVALVLDEIASYTRQQLIRMGVPFVVPGRQMFLPALLVDLRERFPASVKPSARLTATSQVVILRHLLGKQVEGISLRNLARELDYSPMMMSKASQELQAAGLCATTQEGRETHLLFKTGKRPLWEKSQALLRSPVKEVHWVRGVNRPGESLIAGMSALSAMSTIAEDALPTLAMKLPVYRHLLKLGQIAGCPGPEVASAKVECWRYAPAILSDNDTVDRLSLYLSLQDTPDERVAIARESLIEGMPW